MRTPARSRSSCSSSTTRRPSAVREYVDELRAARRRRSRSRCCTTTRTSASSRTVNRGLRHAAGDVVILNSDTAVTDGWLDRLAAAAALADVATVTPLTSHGSICTLPAVGHRCVRARERRSRASTSARRSSPSTRSRLLPEVITGVGFCMYVDTPRRSISADCSTRRPSVAATARRSTSACAPRASACGTSWRTRRSCTTAAACRSATSRARVGPAARRSSTRATRSSGPPTPTSATHDPLARLVRRAGARAARTRPDASARAARPAQPARRDRRHREVRRGAARGRSSDEFDFSVLATRCESGFVLARVLERRRATQSSSSSCSRAGRTR